MKLRDLKPAQIAALGAQYRNKGITVLPNVEIVDAEGSFIVSLILVRERLGCAVYSGIEIPKNLPDQQPLFIRTKLRELEKVGSFQGTVASALRGLQEAAESLEQEPTSGNGSTTGRTTNRSSTMAPTSTSPRLTTTKLTNLVEQCRKNPPSFCGRESLLEAMIANLHRHSKPCPVLIGESGVGKTALVMMLAHKIATGNVPPAGDPEGKYR